MSTGALMNTRVIVFDIRGGAMARPSRPGEDDWETWYTPRGIILLCMRGSKPPETAPIAETMESFEALLAYLSAAKPESISPARVVYVSDDAEALRRAKLDCHFWTIAVPPAQADTTLSDTVSIAFPSVTSLRGLINYIESRAREKK